MKHLAAALALGSLFAMGCASARPPSPSPPPEAASTPHEAMPDDDDLREAVFRHLFKHNASGMQQSAKVYCLEIEGEQDPSAQLLARFDGNEPRVQKASRCSRGGGPAKSGVVDDTGAPGLIFRITSIRRTGAETAVVEGGYFEAGLSASGNVFELATDHGHWIVKRDTMKWIS